MVTTKSISFKSFMMMPILQFFLACSSDLLTLPKGQNSGEEEFQKFHLPFSTLMALILLVREPM